MKKGLFLKIVIASLGGFIFSDSLYASCMIINNSSDGYGLYCKIAISPTVSFINYDASYSSPPFYQTGVLTDVPTRPIIQNGLVLKSGMTVDWRLNVFLQDQNMWNMIILDPSNQFHNDYIKLSDPSHILYAGEGYSGTMTVFLVNN